jgi:hypothetical protein
VRLQRSLADICVCVCVCVCVFVCKGGKAVRRAYLSRSMHGTGVRGRRMTSALLLPGPSHASAEAGGAGDSRCGGIL